MSLLAATLVMISVPAQATDWIEHFLAGSRVLEQGHASAALLDLEAVLTVLPRHGATAWQLAAAHAQLGNPDEAFEWLGRAVDWGAGEATLLEWDPDLAPIRGDARYPALLEDLRARDRERPDAPPRAELFWHTGNSFSFSSSARAEIVAMARGSKAALRDLRAGEVLSVLERPGEDVAYVEVSPDGRWVVTSGSREGPDREHFLRVFDARTGDFVRELEPAGWQAKIQFSRDGARMLAIGGISGSGGNVWDTGSWTPLGWPSRQAEQALFSPDGRRLLLLSRRGTDACDLAFWDVDARQYVAEHELAAIPNAEMDVSPDGALALLLENNGPALHVFELNDGRELQRIEPGEVPFAAACFLGATGELASIDAQGRIRVWEARTGEELRSFSGGPKGWHQLRSSPDGRTLLDFVFNGPLRALDAVDGTELWSAGHGSEEGMLAVRFTPDGTRVLASSSKGPQVRDAHSGELIAAFEGPGQSNVALAAPLRNEIWLDTEHAGLRRIDAASGRATGLWEFEGAGAVGLALSHDNELVAVRRGRTLHVLRAADGSSSAVLDLGADPLPRGRRVSFAPDDSMLLVNEGAERVGIFSTESWERRFALDVRPHTLIMAWSSDGSRLAVVAPDASVSIHAARTGALVRSGLGIEGEVSSLAFEPGGERLWVGSDRSTVHIYDVASGTLVRTLDLSDLDVPGLRLAQICFSPAAGVAVTTTSGYGVVAGWDTATGRRLWDYTYFGGNPSPLHCSIGALGEQAYIWGQTLFTARIVDVRTGATRLDLADQSIAHLLPLSHERTVGAVSAKGTEVLDAETGARLWSRIELPDGGWLMHSPSFFVDGTRAALEKVHVALESRSYPLEALASVLLDPKRVRASAAGVALAPAVLPAIPELTWSERPERVVLLAADEKPPTVTLEANCREGLASLEVRVSGATSYRVVEDGAQRSTLTMEIARPAPGESIDYRWRAVATSGVLSRPLHLTVEASGSR